MKVSVPFLTFAIMFLLADYIDASDVGLTQNMPYFRHGASTRTLPITYLHIYECDKLSVLKDALS